MGVLYRGTNTTELKINLKDNDSTELYIIVENMGRLNFGDDLLDSKVTFFKNILVKYKRNFLISTKGHSFKCDPR